MSSEPSLIILLTYYRRPSITRRSCNLYESCSFCCANSTGYTHRRRHCSSCLKTILYCPTIDILEIEREQISYPQYVEDHCSRKGIRRKWRKGKEANCHCETEFEVSFVTLICNYGLSILILRTTPSTFNTSSHTPALFWIQRL